MSFFRTFRGISPNGDDTVRISDCYHNIKQKVTSRCGVTEFIEKDGSVAFSGTLEKPKLLLTLSVMKMKGKHYLYADIDDETSWHEWDFQNQTEFETAIAEYIVPLINPHNKNSN